MKTNRSKKSNLPQTSEYPRYRYIFTVAVTAAALLAVFAVRLHLFRLTGDSLVIFSSSNGMCADWFLYVKEIIYLIIAAAVCIYAVGERIFPDKPYNVNRIKSRDARPLLICIGVYLIAAFLSSVLSAHREVVLLGMCTEFEGLAAIFSYCVLFCFGYNYICKKTLGAYKLLLTLLIAVVSVLAVVEYLTVPLMTLPFMKYIIAPSEYREAAANISHSNDFREAVLMFNNSNYTGGFFTLMFPVAVYSIVSADKPARRLLGALLTAAAFIGCIMSNSTAAFYIVAAELILMTIFFAFKKLINIKGTLLVAGVFAVAAVGLSLATDNAFLKNIIKSFTNSGAYSTADNKLFRVKSVSIDGYDVRIKGDAGTYVITPPYDEGQIMTISDEGSEKSAVSQLDANNIVVYGMDGRKHISASVTSGILRIDCGYKDTIDFAVTTEGVKAIMQNARLITDIPQSEFAGKGLEKYYSFATGRGYIWLNTLPILKGCLLTGKGCGNYPFVFEQDDIAGLCNTHGTYHIVTDKPHNRYLQIAVTCGIPALIAVLVLFGLFAVRGMRFFGRTAPSELSADKDRLFVFCLMTGCLGFMAVGIVNDSIITVDPLFWLFLGSAFSLIDIMRGEARAK